MAEAHSSNPGAPSYEGSDYFLGTGLRSGGAVVAPALAAHVSERMRADAQIAKERRKAIENRTLANPRKPKGKGDGGKGEGEKK